MNDTDVRELLSRAVDTVTVPAGGGGEPVFARAAAVRRRRRAVVTGAVAAVAVVGVVTGAGLLPGERAAAPAVGAATDLEKLLPDGIGTVREVSLGRLLRGADVPLAGKNVGPYDGEYSVARKTSVGYITVHVDKGVTRPDTTCRPTRDEPSKRDCSTEKLPGGGLLVSYWTAPLEMVFRPADGGPWKNGAHVEFAAGLTARLVLPDATVLTIRDSAGFSGDRAQGAPLNGFPLTRAQLRELVTDPALLP
ncbi:hypothetical protein [Streptomyces sp. T028]|uniref:hypothetical protein n=1 Tax=Streptomyces sp. T028 TaxID=3394379 RepID=UPI003A85FFFB